MLHVLDRHAIGQILRTKEVDAWGVAANVPRLPGAPDYPVAISILMRLDPLVVRGLKHGPTLDYQQEYFRVNVALDDATGTLVDVLQVHGHRAERLQATYEKSNGEKPFPHKTAATVAGLGWIGKTALFVSPQFGPAVRLSTVFTDLELPGGEPVRESSCGACRQCVDACPAGCGRDVLWRPGMEREDLFDAGACRHQMSSFTGVEAQICGICIAACPLSAQH
ncbi:MAG TPA: epoxyqueuosine reductase [Thermoleophilia bacterium]|nr:epoxyqueuosine reductase [Thermoleophilia bacterium]